MKPLPRSACVALVDCNNFYVSCERVFQPRLEKKPVLILSGNDGCVIARSNETKALGIGMGVPFFKIKDLVYHNNVEVMSSNFSLYGDMSERVFNVLHQSAPQVEIYSIDEAFLPLEGLTPDECLQFAKKLVKKIYRWTGIPVSIGLSSTQTLAKAANHLVKKQCIPGGALALFSAEEQVQALSKIKVQDIWGIGKQTAEKLKKVGIDTALKLRDLKNQNSQTLNIQFRRTILELQGKPMFSFEETPSMRQQIIVSRSFAQKISDFNDIRAAVVEHISNAGQTLREENLVAEALTVFLHTNRFSDSDYHHAITLSLPMPSSSTKVLLGTALLALDKIYRPDTQYKKAGVIVFEISSSRSLQRDLFNDYSPREDCLMTTLDDINAIMGRGTLRYGAQGFKQNWKARSSKRSPPYTTCWEALPIVK